jgi:Arc/MetJ-type ribon-helix-helix transcriptional regulator
MEVTLPADLYGKVELAVRAGKFNSSSDLIEKAVRRLLDDAERVERVSSAMKSLGDAVEAAGLYDQTYLPNDNN